MGKKHSYPKNRKPRNVAYSKSYQLLQIVGEDRFRMLFSKHGMYKAADILSIELEQEVSPYVVRHLRTRYKLGVTANEEKSVV